ncbi:MAG TPA: chemotaxis protein CheW [Thermoanaerobaculia bacterium]|nr:chemotaxis protein CheW [Thermoanaerobaculia bacterium]
MEIDFNLVFQTFFAEAEEQLFLMEEAALALEDRPEDAELGATLFRIVHTLKGTASSLGFDAIAALCHDIEEPLERLRGDGGAAGPERVAFLLESVDTLRAMLREAEAASGKAAPAAGPASRRPRRTLRVDLDKLDRLLDLTGEIAIAHGRFTAALERREEPRRQELQEIHAGIDRLQGQLQALMTELRLVAVGPLFRQQIRTAHDLARDRDKLVRLSLEGEDVEVDAALVERLRDPLVHLVRNAVDHGIEPAEERRAGGKDPCGRITLRARHDSGHVVIDVEDDGRGPDRGRLEARAREMGLAAEPELLADADLYGLVFEPGFSTREDVTGVSGRGVGLDVVRRGADSLQGSVTFTGVPGEGARFTLRLPLTLALIEGLAVRAGGETFVLPLDRVVECVDMPSGESGGSRVSGLVNLRGAPLPYLRLRELFALGSEAAARESVVVFEADGGLAGLAVDRLQGRAQTVVKPLGKLFRSLQGISGSALLGDGRVALILDAPSLLREALRRQGDSPC